ncbi:MAG TPA: histidine phosphatase family protein [Gemmatimonadaceae bacterium]|jgi:broad specificity phosphatase PhoE
MSRLLLVRHGPSAHVHDGTWIDAVSARQFELSYDAAAIRVDENPPASLVESARSADLVLASDLARAVASARAIAPGREPTTSPLLRELAFRPPTWGPKLPLAMWDAIEFMQWSTHLFVGIETPETERARAAAKWIDDQAATHALTVVVTHGAFRRLLTVKLEQRGWNRSPERRQYHNWSTWSLSR